MQAHAQRLGSNWLQVEGDLLLLTWVGELLPEDIDGLHACMEGMLENHDLLFIVVDGTRGQSLGPEARRRGASWPHAHRLAGVAVFGASVTVRAMVTIAVALVKVFSRGSVIPLHFAKNEPAARAWIDARRSELSSRGDQPHA